LTFLRAVPLRIWLLKACNQNPIEAGIVSLAEHYLLSSASNYVSGAGVLDVLLLDDIWNDVGFVPTAGI
jgi:hypothetical protein